MANRYLGPYVNFQGRAREAMEFYRDVLGGHLEVDEAEGRVTLARLEMHGLTIHATDGHPRFAPTVGENMAIALGDSDGAAIRKTFDGLAEGGRVKGALTKDGQGPATGYLVDRFGINWIVSIR